MVLWPKSTTKKIASHEVYELDHLGDIMDWCAKRGVDYWNYVEACEGQEIWTYLAEVWEVMKSAVERGLEHEGVLPGELHLQRKSPPAITSKPRATVPICNRAAWSSPMHWP